MENELPSLNVNVGLPQETPPKNELIKTEALTNYYKEIMDDIREDRQETDSVLKDFLEMVMNTGDASSASKEAVVNLLKIKSDCADKKTKVMDLLVRAFLKEKDTFPRYLAVHAQQNQIFGSKEKREFLENLNNEEKVDK